jgi:serine/threonine protein kinase
VDCGDVLEQQQDQFGSGLKGPNSEPIPGYRLIERLGFGGYGEVWKCEAPGGLCKAIKFIYGNLKEIDIGSAAVQDELRAIERIKSIRHPFMLSLERVELVHGELVMVMELADSSLQEVFDRYREAGLPGIPRDELLGYLREAAEALDLISAEHGLQHLDIKPGNLLVVSNHVKVADFGLVSSQSARRVLTPAGPTNALTPRYTAPEVFHGGVGPDSDQYSLAIVYQELLTGTLPFDGKNFRQLLLQHTRGEPDLTPLPEADRAIVARALAKDSRSRFRSCTEFIQALLSASPGQAVRQDTGTGSAEAVARDMVLGQGLPECLGESRQSEASSEQLAPISRQEAKGAGATVEAHPITPPAHEKSARVASLPEQILGELINKTQPAGEREHRAGPIEPQGPHLSCQFHAPVLLSTARNKVGEFAKLCNAQVAHMDLEQIVLRVALPRNVWHQCLDHQRGLELAVYLCPLRSPNATPVEVTVQITPFGCRERQGEELLEEMGQILLNGLRACLQASSQQRLHERFAWQQRLSVSSVYPDGKLGEPIECQGRDISVNGIGFLVPQALLTTRVSIQIPTNSAPPFVTVQASVIRVRRCDNGSYEVGALFLRDQAAGNAPGR